MADIIYKPLDFQRAFHVSTKPIDILSGGYGCGKTYSLVQKVFQLCNYNRGVPGGIVAPDLKMFKRDVAPEIRAQLANANLFEGTHYKYNKQEMYYYFPQTNSYVYIFHGKDHGESIRGPNLGWMALNEVTLMSKDTYLAAVGRVRLKEAPLMQIAMSGTPEGFNWFHEQFIEQPKDNVSIFYGSTRKNHHLNAEYISLLESEYDPLMQRAYIDGEYLNLVGNAAAWAFQRKAHVMTYEPQLEQKYPVWVQVDFNVNPMSAVIWSVINSEYRPANLERDTPEKKIHIRAIKDIRLRNSNTPALIKVLKEELGTYSNGEPRCDALYPDPAGKHRDTRSMTSDIQLFEDAGFKDIRYRRKIVSVKNSLNAMNALFANQIVEISPACKNLIADCEKCVLLDDLTIDKSDTMRSHWIDGFKNMADYEFPVAKPNVQPHVAQRG